MTKRKSISLQSAAKSATITPMSTSNPFHISLPAPNQSALAANSPPFVDVVTTAPPRVSRFSLKTALVWPRKEI